MTRVRRSIVVILFATFFTVSCGSSSDASRSYQSDYESPETPFDEDVAVERAIDDLNYETYGSVGEPYGCTEDCSGHEAGFEWAKENGVTDGSCYGDSESFNEGCQAYADAIEDQVSEYRQSDDSSW
jgi:hypothetical protein